MYFVVFLHKLNKNVVLPSTWIRGMDNGQMEKFVKRSLNRSQRFMCYYTTNKAAFVADCPDMDFVPDFQTMVNEIGLDGQYDGCFIGQLISFRCEYIESIPTFPNEYIDHFRGIIVDEYGKAVAEADGYRNIKPAVYVMQNSFLQQIYQCSF